MELREPATQLVHAAGGVVWRNAPGFRVEYCLVHRPAYDDWSFPKGKVAPQEREEEAALREVDEETGMRCRLGRPLGTTSYVDRRGRPKIVYYWLMRAVGGRFRPGTEVDQVRWLSAEQAHRLLSYDRDRVLLGSLSEPLPDDVTPVP